MILNHCEMRILIYLGGDIVFLVALLVFPLQLLLDQLRQRLLSLTSTRFIPEPVRSLFDLRLAVHALLGSFDVILLGLVLVSADTAQLSLLGQLAGFDSDVLAVKSDGQRVPGGLQLDNLVGGPVDFSKDTKLLRNNGLQLARPDFLLLAVNDNLDIRRSLRDKLDLALAKDDLDLTLAFRAQFTEQDSERLLLGTISGDKVVTPVKINGQSLVVKGLQSLTFDLADGVKDGSSDLLGDELGIRKASLQGQDMVQAVGQTDLPEFDLFLGPVDDQVEGGGHAVELDLGGVGALSDRLAFNGLLFGEVQPQERPKAELQVGGGLGFVVFDMGNVVVPDGEVNLINGTSLFAHLLARLRELGQYTLLSRLALLDQLLALDGLLGDLGELLLLFGGPGGAFDIDGPDLGSRPVHLQGVHVPEVDHAGADGMGVPDGQERGLEVSLGDDLLGRLLVLQDNVPLGLDLHGFGSLSSSNGSDVAPGGGTRRDQSGRHLQGDSLNALNFRAQSLGRNDLDLFKSLNNLFLSLGMSALDMNGFGFNLDGDQGLQSLLEQILLQGSFLQFFGLRNNLDLLVVNLFRLLALDSITDLQVDGQLLGLALAGVVHDGVHLLPQAQGDHGRLVVQGDRGPVEGDHVNGVVLVQSEPLNQGLPISITSFSPVHGLELHAQDITELVGVLLKLVGGPDHLDFLAEGDGHDALDLLDGGEGPDVPMDHLDGARQVLDHLDGHPKLLFRNAQLQLEGSGNVVDRGLVDSGDSILLGEGNDGSDHSVELGSVEVLGLHLDLGLDPAGDKLHLAFHGDKVGHVNVNDDGETHVGGDQALVAGHIGGVVESELLLTGKIGLQFFGVGEDLVDLGLQGLGGHFLHVGKEGSGFQPLGVDSTSHLVGRLTGFNVQLLDDPGELGADGLLELLGDLRVLLFNGLAFHLGSQKLDHLLVQVLHTFGPEAKSEQLGPELGHDIVEFHVHVLGDERLLGSSPGLDAEVSGTDLVQVLGSINGARGREDSLDLLDQGVDNADLVDDFIDIRVSFSGDHGHGHRPESHVDSLQDLLVLFNPGPSGDLVQDGHGRVQSHQSVEGSNPHLGDFSGVGEDGVEDGFDNLGLNFLADGSQSPQSQHPGHVGHHLSLDTSFNQRDHLGNNLLARHHAQGDNDLVLLLPGLSLFHLPQQVGQELLGDDGRFGSAELSQDPGGVTTLTVLDQASLVEQSGHAHAGNIFGHLARLDLLGLDQSKEFLKDLFGGHHQGVGQPQENSDLLDLVDLTVDHLFFQELDGLGGGRHKDSIEEQSLEAGALFLNGENRQKLTVDFLHFSLGQDAQALGNGNNPHGDSLLSHILFGSLAQKFNQLLDEPLNLSLDLGDGKVLAGQTMSEAPGHGLGQLLGFTENLNGDMSGFLFRLFSLVVLVRVLVLHMLQSGQAGGLGSGAGGSDLDQPQDLKVARDKPFGVETEKVLVEFALLNDGLDHQGSAGTASDVAGLGGPGPLVTAVGSGAVEAAFGVVAEGGTPFAVVDVLGLDDFKETLLGALFDLGDQFGPVTDHVHGQLVDLVSHLADAVNRLFLGPPEVVGLHRGRNLKKNFELKNPQSTLVFCFDCFPA